MSIFEKFRAEMLNNRYQKLIKIFENFESSDVVKMLRNISKTIRRNLLKLKEFQLIVFKLLFRKIYIITRTRLQQDFRKWSIFQKL